MGRGARRAISLGEGAQRAAAHSTHDCSAASRAQQGPVGSPAGSPVGRPARGARAEARFHCSCSALAVYGRGGLARARRWLSVARLLEFLPAFPAVVAARHHHLLATISTLPSVTLTRHHLPQTSSYLLASRLLLHWHHSIRHSALHKKRPSQSVLRADRCPRSFLRLVSRSIGHNSAFASIIHPTKKASHGHPGLRRTTTRTDLHSVRILLSLRVAALCPAHPHSPASLRSATNTYMLSI